MMVNCLDINDAANNFVQLHDPAKIDMDYLKKEYGTVANYLDFAGHSLGDQGSRYIEIDSHDSLTGTPQIVEWCEDCYAIGYRHVDSSFPNMDWVKTFLEARHVAADLQRDGYVDIGITFWSEGNPQDSTREGWVSEQLSDIDCDKERTLFRTLFREEELEFRQAARDQYKPGEPIESSWHPIYRDECRLIDTKHRITVAKEFVEMHRIGVEAWTTRLQNPTMDLDEVYLKIHAEMMSGSFGEVRENDVPGGVECEIEISKHDSVNGLPYLYTW